VPPNCQGQPEPDLLPQLEARDYLQRLRSAKLILSSSFDSTTWVGAFAEFGLPIRVPNTIDFSQFCNRAYSDAAPALSPKYDVDAMVRTFAESKNQIPIIDARSNRVDRSKEMSAGWSRTFAGVPLASKLAAYYD
jgi:hypothetical protein